ncbi:NAD-dependent epimerase/dehydratase family protein [Nakamurella aerolata]|uniref:NAD(P)-dependent oxidoreductase n=1 Tax=Nakamurella aerolata TaxID=1656892 RepID=A0A849AC37_9ACTN|nr:NAD-dependent epimerase/dehydratase family protein [Nakamurella aerolata]NNG34452.1 NAD(P)-dependent oxidoreductase [Nakamurella aerolata]
MTILLIGALGAVGRLLHRGLPEATGQQLIGVDRAPGADLRWDLDTVDYADPAVRATLTGADVVIHVATSPDPYADAAVHWQAVASATRLLQACNNTDVPAVLLPSSGWAEPAGLGLRQNSYGRSKQVLESLAAMYAQQPGRAAEALRIGWVPHHPDDLAGADPAIASSYWPADRVVSEFAAAVARLSSTISSAT